MSTVALKWTVPTTRTDGTTLKPDEIAGFDVFDSAAADPTKPIGSVTGAASFFSTDTLSVGMHNFTVVVRDTDGHSSAASNVFSADIKAVLANPAAVTDLTGTINP